MREFIVPNQGVEAAGAPSENLGIFAAGFFEGAGPALTTVLNRKVSVELVELRAVAPKDLVEATGLPCVLAEASYQRGMRGTHYLLLGYSGAVALGQGLTGGEEIDVTRSYEEALRDAFNQILTSAGPVLTPLVGRSVAFAPVSVHVVEDSDRLPEDLNPQASALWAARARAHAEGGLDVEITLTIGAEAAREITGLGAEAVLPAASPVSEGSRADATSAPIDLILDVTLPVTVELGRARMLIQDVLKLAPGSVIELDKAAGDPVELYINDRPIAKGEVVVIDENFGVRLTSIVATTERIKTLR